MGMRKCRYGFTLVELIVTIVVISVIATLVFTRYQSLVLREKEKSMVEALRTFCSLNEVYKIKHGSYYPNYLKNFSAIDTAFQTDLTQDPEMYYKYYPDLANDRFSFVIEYVYGSQYFSVYANAREFKVAYAWPARVGSALAYVKKTVFDS